MISAVFGPHVYGCAINNFCLAYAQCRHHILEALILCEELAELLMFPVRMFQMKQCIK